MTTNHRVSPEIQKLITKNTAATDWIPAAVLNQSSVVIVKGVRGSGKTLFSAICMYHKWKSGYKVFHNGALKFGDHLDIADMLSYTVENDLQDCFIFIDEAQVVFDSWSGGATYLKKLIHYITQLRHKNINLYMTTQFVSDLTARLRQQVDYVISPASYMRIYTTGVKKGMIRSHRINSYYTSTENTPFGFSQQYLPVIYNAEDFYKIYDTMSMIDHSELEEFTSDKVRENIEAQREFHVQQWLKEKIIPVHSGKKVPVMALCNKWNEDSGDIIESKHFAKLIKAMGLSVKKKGRSQQNAIYLPNDVSDLNLTL
jgi:KaiC/GvpD/RAD55 family RecA-like ATPase